MNSAAPSGHAAPMNDAHAVNVSGLSKTYAGADRPALDDVSLSIPKGKIFGLLGPNGAGKTTFLSMVCGLLRPSRGTLRVFGYDIDAGRAAIKRLLGLVPQNLAVYPTLSARENLVVFGRMQGLQGQRLKTRVADCLALAGLDAYAERRVETFSGGLKRRLNLVIGLIHEPQLLVLDEPTVGIDPQSRRFIHATLRDMNAAGMSIIYTSHYMDEVEQLCDELAIIDHGKIIARGAMENLLAQHRRDAIELRTDAAPPAELANELRALPHVREVSLLGKSITLKTDQPHAVLPELLARLARHRLGVVSLSMGTLNLEQVFLSLTGTQLRD